MGSGVATPGAGPVAEPALNQVSRMREVPTQPPRGRKGDAGEVEVGEAAAGPSSAAENSQLMR